MILKSVIALLTGLTFLSVQAPTNTTVIPFNLEEQSNTLLNDNKQIYLAQDNTQHTVYWAKGVKAPLMSSDPQKNDGSDKNYFQYQEETDGIRFSYKSTFDPNRGYFDINKDWQRYLWQKPQCYLASTGNMIHWWLEQNKEYVMRYAQLIKQGGVYNQPDGLIDLYPYNQQFWDDLYAAPGTEINSSGLNSTTMHLSKLLSKHFSQYNHREHGLVNDVLTAYFFNGYPSLSNYPVDASAPEEPREEDYVMDPQGGLFYPIFGKKILTERNASNKYDVSSKFIIDALTNNKIVALSYQGPNISVAHVITLWGAEVNSEGKLMRVFVTDSDDDGDFINGVKTPTGLFSLEVRTNESGAFILNSFLDPTITTGTNLLQLFSLDLKQDLWEAKLNDLEGPKAPKIISESKISTPKGSVKYTEIKTTLNDTGTLSYQWHVADSINGQYNEIEGQTNPKIKLDTSTIGTKYYMCEVLNFKNGMTKSFYSNPITVEINGDPLVNAEKPRIIVEKEPKSLMQLNEDPTTAIISASINGEGTLSYQWYQSSSSNTSSGWKLEGETSNTLKIYPKSDGNSFYYCVVTNTNPNVNGLQEVTAVTKAFKVEVNSFLDEMFGNFLKQNVCGTNDNTKADSTIFKKQMKEFDDLFTKNKGKSWAKNAIEYAQNVVGNEDSSDNVRKYIAKYDRIIYLYGDDTANFPDFLQRKNSPSFTYQNVNQINTNNIDNQLIIISLTVTISIIAISSISIIFIRKRKHR